MERSSSEQGKADLQTQAIINAIEEYDLVDSSAWSDLDVLSTHTSVDALEVDPEGVIIEANGDFRGIANVYVLLKYGTNSDDGFETSDSFIAHFRGHLDGEGNPVIEDLHVDTSSFYEGEEGKPETGIN